jgi:putative transposase
VKYAAIADWAPDKEYTVTFMCDQLGVVRQGYYRWLADGPCEHERTDAELTEMIREIHHELHGHPGVCAGSLPSWSCAECGSPPNGSGG